MKDSFLRARVGINLFLYPRTWQRIGIQLNESIKNVMPTCDFGDIWIKINSNKWQLYVILSAAYSRVVLNLFLLKQQVEQ